MSALDSAADKLRAKSQQLAGQGGVKDKVADLLAEDAAFLPKLKPELIKKRAKGEAATDEKPTEVRQAPSGPQLGKRPRPKSGAKGDGPNPFVVIGVALVAGIGLAKWLDWRGYCR